MKELVTESVAANFFAVAWNKLDAGIIKELLSEDVEYVLVSKNQSLKGRKDLLNYLQRNMNRIKKAPIEYEIFAEIAETMDDRQCVLLAQGNVDKIINAVFFTVEKGKITKIEIDKYDPEVVVWRSGTYPGTEDELNDNEYIENKPKLVSSDLDEELKVEKENDDIDIQVIKEKFMEKNPKFKKKKGKIVWLAALFGFLLPGLGLFYVSLKHGIYNLITVMLVTTIYSVYLSSMVLNNVQANTLEMPVHQPSIGVGLFLSASVFGLLIRIGSALWGYLAAKSINESYL